MSATAIRRFRNWLAFRLVGLAEIVQPGTVKASVMQAAREFSR